nr:ABC transporter permease [Desulfuromonadales bacterium]
MSLAIEADRTRPWVLLSPALLAILFLVVIPMGIIFVYSFYLYVDAGIDQPAFQFANWQEFFTDSYYHGAIWKTLRISVAA